MPYVKIEDAPQSLRTAMNDSLPLVNAWAAIYDAVSSQKGIENPGAVAWATFKKKYKKDGRTWVLKKGKEQTDSKMIGRGMMGRMIKKKETKTCPSCDEEIPVGATECPECGMDLE